MKSMAADLAKLVASLMGKRFCVSPPIVGQEGGDLYLAVRTNAGGLTIRRERDGVEVWIPETEIREYVAANPPADRWDGTLNLSREFAISPLGIAYATRR